MDKRYAAFLSYSHTSDAELSAALRDALQQLSKPWHKARALRVFRDNSSLSANEALWPSIQAAMDASRYFILLASPDSAASPWVALEVERWLAHNPPSTLLIAVTAGDLHWDPVAADFDRARTTSIPPALYGRLSQEPRWVDLRGIPADRHTLRDLQFRDRVADLAAPLHGLGKDDLVGADIRAHRRTRRLVRATIAVLTVLGIVASASAVVAVSRFITAAGEQARAEAERERAQEQESLAEERQRDALIRQLLAEADLLVRYGDDQAAARLSLAALHLRDDAETRAGLLAVTINSPITASLSGLTEAYGLAYSPDGATLAASGLVPSTGEAKQGAVQLWDVREQYRPRRLGEPLTGHADVVYDVRFSPDGELLATAGLDGKVILWNTADPAMPERIGDPLTGHTGGVTAVAFARDRPVLATAGLDGRVILWDLTEPTSPEPIGDPLVHDDQVWSLALSPDDHLLVAGGRDGGLTIWDVEEADDPTQVAEQPGAHDGSVTAVAFNPAGDRLATGSADAQVTLWNVADPSEPERFTTYDNDDPVGSVVFSPGGEELAVSGHGRQVDQLAVPAEADGLLVPVTLAPPLVLEQSDGEVAVQRVVYSPDGESIAAAAHAGVVAVWDRDVVTVQGTETPFYGSVAAPSPDGHSVIVGDRSGAVSRWDVTDPANARRLAGPIPTHDDEIAVIAFSGDGALAATVGFLDTVQLWDSADPAELTPIGVPLEMGDVRAVAFFADSATLAAATTDQGVTLWDISDPAEPVSLGLLDPDSGARSWTLDYSPERQLLAVGGLTDPTTLWDVSDPRQPRRLGEPIAVRRGGTYDLAFSPNGSMLAAGDDDGSLVLWNVDDPERPARIGRPVQLHHDNIRSITFSPDGSLLATSSWDGRSALLDLGFPARPVVVAKGLTVQPTVAFSPVSLMIVASGALNYPVELYDYSLANSHREHLVERACAIAGRGLTEPEWTNVLPSIPYHDTCPVL